MTNRIAIHFVHWTQDLYGILQSLVYFYPDSYYDVLCSKTICCSSSIRWIPNPWDIRPKYHHLWGNRSNYWRYCTKLLEILHQTTGDIAPNYWRYCTKLLGDIAPNYLEIPCVHLWKNNTPVNSGGALVPPHFIDINRGGTGPPCKATSIEWRCTSLFWHHFLYRIVGHECTLGNCFFLKYTSIEY